MDLNLSYSDGSITVSLYHNELQVAIDILEPIFREERKKPGVSQNLGENVLRNLATSQRGERVMFGPKNIDLGVKFVNTVLLATQEGDPQVERLQYFLNKVREWQLGEGHQIQ